MAAATLVVLGTDTGCGKTALTAALAGAMRARGERVAALKMMATGVPLGGCGADAELLAAATQAHPRDCVLDTFELARSPLAAARAEGRIIDVAGVVRSLREAARRISLDLLLIEGTGGVLVPVAPDMTVRDVVRELGAPVLVAARAGLGTINHTALTVEACRAAGVEIAGVILVQTEPESDASLVAENAAQISDQCGIGVLGVLPHLADPRDPDALTAAALRSLDLDALRARVVALQDVAASAARCVLADRRHLWHPFTQTAEWLDEEPLVIRSGRGCRLRTVDGREYVDAIGALWANVHGYAHPGIDAAIREQLGRVAHCTLLGQTHEPAAQLAAELCGMAPPGLTRVFYGDSGAGAVEAALRIALLAQRHRGETARTRFLSLENGYHGDTAGAVSVGRSEPFHGGLDPLLFEAVRLRPPHGFRLDGLDESAAVDASFEALDQLLRAQGEELAALVIEPRVQGAAGIWTHPDHWAHAVTERCRRAGLLVVCDEVATGFGRTGDMFASAAAGVQPDILCLGKALSGGYLPLSATVVREEVFQLFTAPYAEHRTLYYGHTFTGNPLACAAGLASLWAFRDEDVLERGRALGARLENGLGDLAGRPGVAEVRQRGVMVGIELSPGDLRERFDPALRVGRRVTLAARRRGVIVRPLGDVVVLNPALVMSAADCSRTVEAVTESIEEVVAALPAMASHHLV